MTPIPTQQYLPWQESITLTSVRASGDVTASCKAGCYQRQSQEAAPSGGVVVVSSATFTIDTDAVEFDPKVADVVTWNGAMYTVLMVGGSAWLKFWKLEARNLAIAADLQGLATVYRTEYESDNTGKRIISPQSSVYDAIPCRLQEDNLQVTPDLQGGPTGLRAYTLLVARRLYLKVGDVIGVTPAGSETETLYDFRGSANFDRLAEPGKVTVYRDDGQG